VNVAVYFAQILKNFARIMAKFSALGMQLHPHAVHLQYVHNSLSVNTFSASKVCTSIPGAEISWVNFYWLISASF